MPYLVTMLLLIFLLGPSILGNGGIGIAVCLASCSPITLLVMSEIDSPDNNLYTWLLLSIVVTGIVQGVLLTYLVDRSRELANQALGRSGELGRRRVSHNPFPNGFSVEPHERIDEDPPTFEKFE